MAFIVPEGITRGTHQFTTKRQNRFVFSIDDDPTVQLSCKGTARPSVNNNEIRIPHINKVRYEKGLTEYDPLNLTFYDWVVPSTSQYLMEWLMMHSETKVGRDGYPSFYRRQCTLEMLGPSNDVVERWEYYNCFITSAQFGDVTWESDQAVEINVTIRYDDVELKV